MGDHDELVLEVRSFWAGEDPPIKIFSTELRCDHALWPETFGSVELLRAYLTGLKSVLGILSYGNTLIDWNIPEQWQEPSGLRWTIRRNGIPKREELNSAGEVLTTL